VALVQPSQRNQADGGRRGRPREARKDEKADVDTIKVKLRFSDGSLYDQVGEINLFDVTVDRSTDSVTLRATIPNPGPTDR
jgi:hypothetical protein